MSPGPRIQRRARRWLLPLAALASMGLLPGSAHAAQPTVIDFDDLGLVPLPQGHGNVSWDASGSFCSVVAASPSETAPPSRPNYVRCPAPATLTADPRGTERHSLVGAFVRRLPYASIELSASFAPGNRGVATVEPGSGWASIAVADPAGAASIDSFVLTATGEVPGPLDTDSVILATTNQPETTITEMPPAVTASGGATFAFRSAVPISTFECRLDGGSFAPCRSAKKYDGLADGKHSFSVRGKFDAINADAPSPPVATYSWVVKPDQRGDKPDQKTDQRNDRPDQRRDDKDDDRVRNQVDNCPGASNPNQRDRDGDGAGDDCDPLDNRDLPPVAGVRATIREIKGDVFVKLPSRPRGARVFGEAAAAAPESGFIPLKGVASVPIGSTLDTRRGEVELTTAASSNEASTTPTQSARLRAGIFAIKQNRAARAFTDLELVSAARAETACLQSRKAHGVVRSLSVSAKGRYRTVGGASTTITTRRATWSVTDRCDGTVTKVGRGRVSVRDRAHRRPVTVPAGKAYFAPGRLLRKGLPHETGRSFGLVRPLQYRVIHTAP
jgi:hypothetical protein